MPSKQWVSSNTILYLASLFLALIIWLIAKQGEMGTGEIYVQVRGVNIPDNCEVQLEPDQRKIRVKFQFPRSQEKFVVSSNFWIELDLSMVEKWAGVDDLSVSPYTLSLDSVQSSDVPDTVVPIAIKDPKNVYVRARLHTRMAKVSPQLSGKPASPFHLSREPVASPERIRVTAHPDLLDRLEAQEGQIIVQTEPVSIEEKERSFVETTKVVLPESSADMGALKLVNPNETDVVVNVYIEEDVETKVFENVRLKIGTIFESLEVMVHPSSATVTVEAPVSILTRIEPGRDFVFNPLQQPLEEPGVATKVAIEARFSGNVPFLRHKAVIKAVEPNVVTITYSKKQESRNP